MYNLICLKAMIRIGIDIDGVMRDLYNPLIKKYKEIFPNKKVRPIEQWDYKIENNFEIGEKIRVYWFNFWANEIYFEKAKLKESKYKCKDENG